MSFEVNPFGRVLAWDEGGTLVLAPSHVDSPLSFSGGIWTRYPVAAALPHDGLLVDFEEKQYLAETAGPDRSHTFSVDDEGNTESVYLLAATIEWPWSQSISIVTSQRRGCVVLYQVKVERSKSCLNQAPMPAQAIINVHLPSTGTVAVTKPAPFVVSQEQLGGKLRLHTVEVDEVEVSNLSIGQTMLELKSQKRELQPGGKLRLSIMLSFTK